MQKIERRIAAIERCARNSSVSLQDAAYERIFLTLRRSIIESAFGSQEAGFDTCHKAAKDSPQKSFRELLCELWERMQANALTNDDRNALAMVPADALQAVGMTAEDAVNSYKRIFDKH